MDPKHWYLDYEVCNGKRQSPVNIDCQHITCDATLTPLTFTNYNVPVVGLLHNDGHTIKIDIPASANMLLTSPGLPAPYRLSQFHFHWGTIFQGGSEHTINGKRWPLEMHMVHVDINIPANQTTINPNGMVVVSTLFDHKGLFDKTNTDAIETISQYAEKVVLEGDQVNLTNFIISTLFPDGYTNNYLRYSGSLTTPPCAEVVEWFILAKNKVVTPTQLARFRSTRQRIHSLAPYNDNGKEIDIRENDRPLQPLNNRPIRLMGTLGTNIPKCNKVPCAYG